MSVVSGLTRELACLAVGHDDDRHRECPATDEELMAELVAEVHRLREAVGEETDPARVRDAVNDAVSFVARSNAVTPVTDLGAAIVAALSDGGWRVVPYPS